MIWTREDELAVAACREALERCAKRHVTPAPYFGTAVKMYEALEKAGMLERGEEGGPSQDLCEGCPRQVNGSCLRAHRGAQLSLDGKTVVQCAFRWRPEGALSGGMTGTGERGAKWEEARREEARKWKGR